jgi:hypothetical protein
VARNLNLDSYASMILTASFAIVIGGLLFIFTGVEVIIVVSCVLLAIGLGGVWIGDRRRQAALVGEGSPHGFGTGAGVRALIDDPVAREPELARTAGAGLLSR